MQDKKDNKEKTKILQQQYRQIFAESKNSPIMLRFNNKERALLETMMKEEEWENMSGFIKYKLFGDKVDKAYEKKIGDLKKEDIMTAMKYLIDTLNTNIGYMNFRFTYELEQLENIENPGKKFNRKISILKEWINECKKRNVDLYETSEKILTSMNIKVKKILQEDVRYAPQSLLDKVSKDWNDTTSPLALEAARRNYENIKKIEAEKYKKREEAEKNKQNNPEEE